MNDFLSISDKYLEKYAAPNPMQWQKFFQRGLKGAMPGAALGAGVGGIGGFIMPETQYDILGREIPTSFRNRIGSGISGALMGGMLGGAAGAAGGMRGRLTAMNSARAKSGPSFMTQNSAGTKWTGAGANSPNSGIQGYVPPTQPGPTTNSAQSAASVTNPAAAKPAKGKNNSKPGNQPTANPGTQSSTLNNVNPATPEILGNTPTGMPNRVGGTISGASDDHFYNSFDAMRRQPTQPGKGPFNGNGRLLLGGALGMGGLYGANAMYQNYKNGSVNSVTKESAMNFNQIDFERVTKLAMAKYCRLKQASLASYAGPALLTGGLMMGAGYLANKVRNIADNSIGKLPGFGQPIAPVAPPAQPGGN